ncbi:transglycosylase family protein [Jatrophihabitans sp. YIM 134969]
MVVLALAATLLGATLLGPAAANADPSADSWYRLRMCESSNNYRINTGNGYYGAYQFDLATWRSVGGSGYPNQASAAEQDARALQLYRNRGWQPWTCARILGLREDGDARSGRPVTIPGTPGTPTTPPRPPASSTAPAWPGVYYSYGDRTAGIATFQRQMATRGAPLTGTGQFGPNTLAVVKRLQAANGIAQTGLLGPVTWKLAWNGRY